MNRTRRFNRAYEFLKFEGVIHKQEDVAKAMGAGRPNISLALKGDESVLTERFIIRFCNAFKQISLTWLLYGEGPMLTIDPEFKDENTPQIMESEDDKDVIEEQKNMTSRIMELIHENGHIPKTFALKADIEVSLFLKKVKGSGVWSVADVHKICDTFRIRKGWLVDGDGDKYRCPEEVLEKIPALPQQRPTIDQGSLINAALAAKDSEINSKNETIASQRETIESLKRENAMLRQQLSKYQEEDTLSKFHFPPGVAEDNKDNAHV